MAGRPGMIRVQHEQAPQLLAGLHVLDAPRVATVLGAEHHRLGDVGVVAHRPAAPRVGEADRAHGQPVGLHLQLRHELSRPARLALGWDADDGYALLLAGPRRAAIGGVEDAAAGPPPSPAASPRT